MLNFQVGLEIMNILSNAPIVDGFFSRKYLIARVLLLGGLTIDLQVFSVKSMIQDVQAISQRFISACAT